MPCFALGIVFECTGWLRYLCGKIKSRALVSVFILRFVSATQRMVVALMLKSNARSLACLCIVWTFASGWDLIEFIPLFLSDYRMILIKNAK